MAVVTDVPITKIVGHQNEDIWFWCGACFALGLGNGNKEYENCKAAIFERIMHEILRTVKHKVAKSAKC